MKNCVPVVRVRKCEVAIEGLLFGYRSLAGDWYLCNDSEAESLRAIVTFHGRSNPLPMSTKVKIQVNSDGEFEASAHLLPLECIPFVAGRVKQFSVKVEVLPTPRSFFDSIARYSREKCKDELNAMMNYVKDNSCTNHLERYVLERNVLSDCVQTGMPYVDVHFPPDITSLHRNDETQKSVIAHASTIYWQRAKDFVSPAQRHRVCVYGPSSISSNNVNQGMLGNCWFIAALAALAEHPGSVRRILSSPKKITYTARDEHSVGGYHVTLNYNGWWVTTIVDDYFPRGIAKPGTAFSNRWYFACCGERKTDLWVPLIEKACAKLYGSYASLKAGNGVDALQDLTGSAVYRFWSLWRKALKDETISESLFRMLHSYQTQGYLVSLASPAEYGESGVAVAAGVSTHEGMVKLYSSVGLQPRHVYTVVDARFFPVSNLRLLKLRNPTGVAVSWNGDWGHTSQLWEKHPNIELSCDAGKAEKGTFWMEWKDILRYFNGGGVCFLQPTWYDYRVRGRFADVVPQVALEVFVSKPTKVFVALQQMGHRGMDRGSANFPYKGICVWITRSVTSSSGAEQELCSTSVSDSSSGSSEYTFSFSRSTSANALLTPEYSPYYIIPQCNERRTLLSVRSKYILSVNSEHPVGPDVKIRFKQFGMDCAAFRRELRFDVGTSYPQHALYQRRSPGETLPETCWGTAFDDGKVYL